MAYLSAVEKLKLEKIFSMSGGYVLDFSNPSIQRFILSCVKLDIYNSKYDRYGSSKANRLRALWETEPDTLIGRLIEEMLAYYEAQQKIDKEHAAHFDKQLFEECLAVAYRLQGKKFQKEDPVGSVDDFLKKEVDEVPISSLGIDGAVTIILEQRIVEVKQSLKAGLALSTIFLCGSILEGILLGVASKKPKEFNQSPKCPRCKATGKPKLFHEWTLSNFIEVAHDIGLLGLDVQKYGHSLRDFRNYIHPYEQMSSGFNPDMHTAKISWQVLKAAIHDIHLTVK
jgi:hypothetical protein